MTSYQKLAKSLMKEKHARVSGLSICLHKGFQFPQKEQETHTQMTGIGA